MTTATLLIAEAAACRAAAVPAERTDFGALIKSKQRVKTHGEVFTPAHMVNQMLDLVTEDLETGPDFINSTFLEPAAGDGNFLVTILGRKLAAIETRLPAELWSRESLFALASIYAIELLEDNHADAQAAMRDVFVAWHRSHGTGVGLRTNLYRAAKFLVSVNIRQGDTLTGLTVDGDDIEFSWWHRARDNRVTREPFTFRSLRQDAPPGDLFSSRDEPVVYAPCRIDHIHKELKAPR